MTMKTIKKLLFSFVIILGLAGIASAQTALTQTTLAAAMQTGPAAGQSGLASGNAYQTVVNVTSNTGINIAVNGQPITFLYVDKELFGVLSQVTGTTTFYNVLRAQQGTLASPHSLGAMVLIQTITPQFGGGAGSGGFQAADPAFGGSCTAANTLFYPWVNIITGAQWLCSPVTSTWTPSFNNPLFFVALAPNGATVASAAGTVAAPSSAFSVSGALAITAWTVPTGCGGQTPPAASVVGTCTFAIYPTGAFTTTATNNIANATTAVVGKWMYWTYNPATQKFGSSY
jgi:hypothetical protein